MKKIFLILFFAAYSFSAISIKNLNSLSAAESSLKKINLHTAIEIGLKNNHDYKIALLKQKSAKEKINAVWGQLLPVIESEVSATGQFAESGLQKSTDGMYDVRILQARFGINPGVFANSLLFSRKAYQVSTEDLKKIKSETTTSIIKSYFSVIVASEMVSLRQENIRLLKENLKDIENMFRTGSVPKFDLLQAQVRVKAEEPALLESENNYRTAVDIFNYNLGLNEPVYASDETEINSEFRLPEGTADEALTRLIVTAMKNRPEIIQIKIKKEMAGYMKNMYNSYWIWPTFSVAGNIGYTKNLYKTDDTLSAQNQAMISSLQGTTAWQNNWQIRAAATYRWSSLIPADTNWANKRDEKIKMEQADVELIKIQRLVSISIKSGYYDLVTARKTIISHRENVEKSEEGLRIARESFKAGIIKNSELLASQLSLGEAKAGYINSVNKYYLALADLQREIGLDDESIIFGGKTK